MPLTWDGVLASMQRRAELAALHLPIFPPSATLMAFRLDGQTAAGDSTDRVTGSRNTQGQQS